jgi:hypothetical protein
MAIDDFSNTAREDRDFEAELADAAACMPSHGSKDYDCAAPAAGTASSHAFDGSRHGIRIWRTDFFCVGIEIAGLSFSGGEALQQGQSFGYFCEFVKLRRPSSSIGGFTGYALRENWPVDGSIGGQVTVTGRP